MGGSGAYSPGPVMGSSGPYHTGPVMGGGGLTSTIPVRSAGGPDHVVSHVAGQKVKDGARIDVTMILMYAGIAYAVYYFVLR